MSNLVKEHSQYSIIQENLSQNDRRENLNSDQISRLNNLESWRNLNILPYGNKFEISSNFSDLQVKYKDLNSDIETEDFVNCAGRIISIRNDGMFIDLQDHSGKIQVFCHTKNLDLSFLKNLKLFDLCDIIKVCGKIRRTKRGELTISATLIEILAKSLQSPPEKYHGLTNIDARYRKRYIDLNVNEESKNILLKRSKIIKIIRNTLDEKGFLEVETPMLHAIPGGAAAKPFLTHHNALEQDLFLRVAPELHLKRLIIGGISDKIFEINRCFRNEGVSTKHNPEFTSVEIYQIHADYKDMIKLTEDIVSKCIFELYEKTQIKYGEKIIDFSTPWRCESMIELIKQYTQIDFLLLTDVDSARSSAAKIGVEIQDNLKWGEIVEKVFGEKVEHLLINPTHVIEIPKDISPLAKAKENNPMLSERFETYINGWEIANAFSELNDPFDQYERFKEQIEEKMRKTDQQAEQYYFDEDFVESLEFGMPPTGGLGIGIDRLVMLLTNAQSIKDVIAFPAMKQIHANSVVKSLHKNRF